MTEPLKIGLIGAGGASSRHLPAFIQFPGRVRLTAICDYIRSHAESIAEETGCRELYCDAEMMLRRADIDAVDICINTAEHYTIAMSAIDAGKHVLVEKPMATNLEDCQRMIAAAEKKGVVLMAGQCRQFMPMYRATKKAIARGDIGCVRAVRFDTMLDIPSFAPYGHWMLNGAQAGGGVVISQCIHGIDLMRYFIGDVVRVTAICRNTSSLFLRGAENFACAILEFENGAIGEMFGTFSGFRMPWGEQFMIFGDEGTIHAVPPKGEYEGEVMIATRKSAAPFTEWTDQFRGFVPLAVESNGLPSDDAYVCEILHFVDCCKRGIEPQTSGRHNINTMKTVFAIYESSRTGASVELSTL